MKTSIDKELPSNEESYRNELVDIELLPFHIYDPSIIESYFSILSVTTYIVFKRALVMTQKITCRVRSFCCLKTTYMFSDIYIQS